MKIKAHKLAVLLGKADCGTWYLTPHGWSNVDLFCRLLRAALVMGYTKPNYG